MTEQALEQAWAFSVINRFWQVNTGGKRGELPLTAAQVKEILEYIRQTAPDLPEDHVRVVDNLELNTAYSPIFDILQIGSDVMPGSNVGQGTLTANPRLGWRGSIAHELVGHREAALANKMQDIDALEEAQASIRAARFGPNLNRIERYTLLRDAIARLRSEDIKIRDVREALFIHQS